MDRAPKPRGPEPLRVAAIVVNWNGADQLDACLGALTAQDHEDLEVVVVDNASTDNSAGVLASWHERGVRTIFNDTNRGFAGGVNDGLAATASDAVLVANFDVRPQPDHVRRLVETMAADDQVGSVQGKLVRFEPSRSGEPVIDSTGHLAFRNRLFRNRGEGEVDRGQWDQPGEVFGVSGALALYRRSMLNDIALPSTSEPSTSTGAAAMAFDEELFAYFEDVDVDWRARARGWKSRYTPEALAAHQRGGAGVRRSATVERLNFVNRIAVIRANDATGSLLRSSPAVVVTTLLKMLELLLTVPRAFLGAVRDLASQDVSAKRAHIDATRTVTAAAIADEWFGGFDYRLWVVTWWRRIRGVPPGS